MTEKTMEHQVKEPLWPRKPKRGGDEYLRAQKGGDEYWREQKEAA